MTNEQILKQAIEKAEKYGYNTNQLYPAFPPKEFRADGLNKIIFAMKEKIIFSHDFAKAFWGEKGMVYKQGEWKECDYNKQMVLSDSAFCFMAYEYHLMEMVREKEPLQYLKKFL